MLKTFMSLPQPMPESILDQFPCPVSKIDRNYYILYRNTASVRSNGPTPPEAYARHCYEWIGRSERCPQCGSDSLDADGIAIQRLEEELANLLPGTPVIRLDRDVTAGRRDELPSRLTAFREHGGVLLGTQMIA